MSIAEILGWVKSVLDTFGLSPFITVFILLSLAAAMLWRFLGRD